MGTTSKYYSKLKILENLEKLIILSFEMIDIIPPPFTHNKWFKLF